MQLFDTHAHLDQADFDADRAEVVARAREAGVENIISIGTTAATSAVCVRLAAEFAGVFAAVGMQPNYIAEAAAGRLGPDRRARRRSRASWRSARRVSIGTGTSRRSTCSRTISIGTCGSPRSAACRSSSTCAIATTTSWRCCAKPTRAARCVGVMHSFTGGAAMAEECLAMGLHISFAGMVTYKKSDELRAVAASVPDDRILIETDAPTCRRSRSARSSGTSRPTCGTRRRAWPKFAA